MFETARLSTVRMVLDTIAPLGQDIQYYDWDDHAEPGNLPDIDLAGVIGFAATQNSKFHDLTFGVGIVTTADKGIYRLTRIIDLFYERLKAEAQFPIFHPDGTPGGKAVVFDGTTVSPIARVEVRPAQSISVSARLVPE